MNIYPMWKKIKKHGYSTQSSKFPNQKSHMVSIDQNATLDFIVEVGTKVHPTNNMPTPPKLLLKTFLYVLCSIFQISQLTFHHLTIDVFRDQQSVLTHVHLHVTKLDIGGDLDVRCLPILGNASPTHFFIITCSLCLLLLRCHYCMFKFFYYQFQNYTSIIKKSIQT